MSTKVRAAVVPPPPREARRPRISRKDTSAVYGQIRATLLNNRVLYATSKKSILGARAVLEATPDVVDMDSDAEWEGGTEGSSNGSSTPASSDGVSIDSRREAYIQSMQSETRVFVRECLNRIVGILLDQFPLRVELRYQEIINVCLFESIYGEFFLGDCPDRCHASLFTCCQG